MTLPSFTRQVDDPASHPPTAYDAHASVVNEMMDEIEPMVASTPHPRYANVETLSGNKTLTDADLPIQSLDPNGASRNVTLPANAATNHAYYFWNRAATTYDLVIKNSGGTTIATIGPASGGWVLPDGSTGWIQMGGGGGGGTWGSITGTLSNQTDLQAALDLRAFWKPVLGSPVRASNTTFTVTGDYTTLFKKGMIVWWKESGTSKFGMVSIPSTYSAPNTTITIIGDTMASIDSGTLKYAMIGVEAFAWKFALAGTIGATGADVANARYAEEPMKILGADLQVGTAGTTNNTTVDINKNGTTMFTTKPTLATTVASSPTPFTADSGTTLALGDKITCDVDAVQTTPAIDLYVTLYVMPSRYEFLT